MVISATILVALALGLVLLEAGDVDRLIQNLLYIHADQAWLLSGREPLSRLLFYDGPRWLFISTSLGLLICLILSPRWPGVRAHARSLRIVVACFLLIPLTISQLKAHTNIACPKQLLGFGGEALYMGILSSASTTGEQFRCFPAGHASGGFALMACSVFFRDEKHKRRMIFAAIAIGWILGIYKMIIGDHFFSHTLVSMFIAGLLFNLVLLFDSFLPATTGGLFNHQIDNRRS